MAQGSRGLPETAQARMAEIKASGTWGSALSTAEFTAIRNDGFVPVGQAFGAVVFSIKNAGSYGCPTYRERPGRESSRPTASSSYRQPVVRTVVSGSKGKNAFRPLVQALYEARRTAIDRMAAEATALGGHGVVGVRFEVAPFPAGGLEVRALGTAIQAPGGPPVPQPFTCELSGQEFTKLLLTGWTPVAIVLGISIGVRHYDDRTAFESTAGAAWNATEVSGHTQLANETRRDASEQLRRDVSKHHASGVVTREMELRVEEYECDGLKGAKDHMAEATIVGTAITRFGPDQPRSARIASQMVLSLGDRDMAAEFAASARERP
jgi:uncharacterized protein YbjQ (UPF0145 family)